MKALNVFLSVVVSLLIAVLVFEAGLRLLGMGPTEKLVEFDAQLGWSKKPNYEIDRSGREFDVVIRTNEHGLNDDPMPSLAKSNGTFRVIALGDSFTQGFSVDRDHLFVDQLERWWEVEGRDIELVNAGTEAYDTSQEVQWLLDHGDEYEPDLVLLFPYENDLYWNSQSAYAAAEGERRKPRFAADGTPEPRDFPAPPAPSWLTTTATGKLFAGRAGGTPEEHLFTAPGASRPTLKELGVLLVDEPGFMADVRKHTAGALRALQRKCEELGAEALVVPIPARAVYDAEYRETLSEQLGGVPQSAWSADKPVELFLSLAEEVGLRTLDPRPYLEQEAAHRELYFKYDWHFNPEGNAAFAGFLHDTLDGMGLVPPASRPGPMPPPPEAEGGLPFALKLFLVLWVGLTVLYWGTYPEEPRWQPPLKIAGLLAVVFGLFLGIGALQRLLPPNLGKAFVVAVVLGILGFVAYKLGRRLGTILELVKAFTLRGHWYLMPLVVVLLTIGSLLVVAASSPLVAPFIYTLF